MLFTLSLLTICILIALTIYLTNDKRDRLPFAIISISITSIMASIVLCIFVLESYLNYVELKQREITIHQYAENINLYSKLATSFKGDDQLPSELTDFKYQSYQEGIKELSQQLRGEVVKYNKTLIGKRILENGIVFNWLITMPDKNMKVIKMRDVLPIE